MKKQNLIIILLLSVMITSCDKKDSGIYAEIETNYGTMILKLFYQKAPLTVANFITLAEGENEYVADSLKGKPFYDGIIFHRVISDFMIQGGDPAGTGSGGPGYRFKDEFHDSLTHNKKGILSMANAGPTTNGSQFFITLKETPHLDNRHSVFGEIIKGTETLDSIGHTKTGDNDKPEEDIIIKHIKIKKYGGEAKKYDAKKIFSDYMNEQKKNEEKRNEAIKQEAENIKTHEEKANSLPSGIKVLVLNQGSDKKPKEQEKVLVNYAGYLKNGMLFDSNWEEIAEKFGMINPQRQKANGYVPMPVIFSKDMSLIPGFVEALKTMSFGQKIRVFIPSKLGYGERGSGEIIPPNSDLIFDIELIEINE